MANHERTPKFGIERQMSEKAIAPAAITIQVAQDERDLRRCYPIYSELRPKFTLEDFLERVQRLQSTAQFQVIYASDHGNICGVAGFRRLENLALDRFLYVDDLVVGATRRSKGIGAALFAWLEHHARTERCTSVILDSGVQRSDAHRFYFARRMTIAAFNFELPL
jgi:GNAT superfamily N-acetyltransferase